LGIEPNLDNHQPLTPLDVKSPSRIQEFRTKVVRRYWLRLKLFCGTTARAVRGRAEHRERFRNLDF
jgi:hypothetical protein